MSRAALLCCLLALALGTPVRADDPPAEPLRAALALQQVVQKVIADTSPSVACILVSRSDAYARFGLGPSADNPGQLGGYDPDAVERHPLARNLSADDRKDLARRLDLADPTNLPEAYGSGVVVDEAGLILTSYHVVRDATKVFVRLPGDRNSYADIYAADPRSDLAVLRLLNRNLALTALHLGDGGKAQRGQFILTIANPFAAGFRDGQPSASWGIISNVRRRVPGHFQAESDLRTLYHYGALLQTDARLHLGCSGGALVNLRGEMIGLTTALAAIQGGETPGGFAVPLDAGLRRIIEVLKRGEEVEYGFLGVRFDPRVERTGGVLLAHVYPGSPADRAGLHARDLITAVGGTPVRDTDDLLLALGVQLAGSRIRLEVRPYGRTRRETLDVTLAKFYVPGKKIATEKGARPFFRGLRVDDTSLLVQQPPLPLLPRVPAGVLVSEVQPSSPAATALFKAGDIITHVNGRVVNTPAAFYEAVQGLAGRVELTLAASNPGQPAPRVTLH
jgi:S1-C subfamily serine protease